MIQRRHRREGEKRVLLIMRRIDDDVRVSDRSGVSVVLCEPFLLPLSSI